MSRSADGPTRRVELLDLAEIHADLGIEEELCTAVDEVVRSGRYVLGPALDRFEEQFATFCGARHCIGVGSGFDALALSLQVLGVGPGDEVLVPSHTFVATWMAVSSLGATPVAVPPTDPTSPTVSTSFLMSVQGCEERITSRTVAIVPVHLYGHPVDMASLLPLAERHGLHVVEDAAQSQGATIHGSTRYRGAAAAYSFYPGKNLGALGDAGAVITDDDATASALRQLRNYGGETKNRHSRLGRNSRLDEIQSAALSVKLGRLADWNERRREIADRYTSAMDGLDGLVVPLAASWADPVWHQFPVRSARRRELVDALARAGIQTGRHYPLAVQDTPAYAGDGSVADPAARNLAEECFSLPIGPHLDDAEIDHVVRAVSDVVTEIATTTTRTE